VSQKEENRCQEKIIGHVCVLGAAPNAVGQEQNIFVFVESSA